VSQIISTTDLGDGFTIEQLSSENGSIYYRVCHAGMCRYCEDEYMSRMYAEQMGYNPLSTTTPPQA
jgi:hypothetical protein